eukprot:scaffold51036_cov65-Phaeocystis_antarctica.AAC.7
MRRRTCEFRRGTVGSAGTRQPAAAARRSQTRGRARPAHDAGVHLRPHLAPPTATPPRVGKRDAPRDAFCPLHSSVRGAPGPHATRADGNRAARHSRRPARRHPRRAEAAPAHTARAA